MVAVFTTVAREAIVASLRVRAGRLRQSPRLGWTAHTTETSSSEFNDVVRVIFWHSRMDRLAVWERFGTYHASVALRTKSDMLRLAYEERDLCERK